jgi:hypothetical protein
MAQLGTVNRQDGAMDGRTGDASEPGEAPDPQPDSPTGTPVELGRSTPTGPAAVPEGLRTLAETTMERHWRSDGYTSPNLDTYPWQWLWDSCFHALIWARLGRTERAVEELAAALEPIDDAGFVPHMRYQTDPQARADFWGRPATSSITQPPMYGHALAEMHRAGVDLPDALLARATAGLRFLLDRRVRTGGLIAVVHPWETGCDDSPRWDHWSPDGYERKQFKEEKGRLVATIERTEGGAPIDNPAFAPGSVGFNALVAFNALELSEVTGDSSLSAEARALTAALVDRWDDEAATWVDSGPHAADSGRIRTADSLLPLLVHPAGPTVDRAFEQLSDPAALGGIWGPAGVDRRETAYDPDAYWRGPCWPQLAYLLWRAAEMHGRTDEAHRLARTTIAGAERSGLAEYWNPDTGAGRGAIPQSWTAAVLLME